MTWLVLRHTYQRCTMRRTDLHLALAVILAGCAQHRGPPPVPVEDDPSIVFPPPSAQAPVQVGSGGVPYELDGVVLRALMIAANHYRPPGGKDQPCWVRQEAQRYEIIRQGDIIFVDISEDLAFCGLAYISLDSGATYAISTDGRILRRVDGAHPDRIMGSVSPPQDMPPPLPAEQHDGGTTGPTSPVPSPAPPPVPDGGPARAP
jgi:hypothetical protein